MKRAKKGLAAILSTCMLLSLLPVAAFAEGAPAADTLEEAAQPTTVEKTLAEIRLVDAQVMARLGGWEQIYLLRGAVSDDYKKQRKRYSWDLNGHTITGDNKNIALRAIGTEAGKGTLQITNGTIKTNSGTYCTVGAKDAALELSDMRLENSTAYGCSVKAFGMGTIDLKRRFAHLLTGGGRGAGGAVNIYDSTLHRPGIMTIIASTWRPAVELARSMCTAAALPVRTMGFTFLVPAGQSTYTMAHLRQEKRKR